MFTDKINKIQFNKNFGLKDFFLENRLNLTRKGSRGINVTITITGRNHICIFMKYFLAINVNKLAYLRRRRLDLIYISLQSLVVSRKFNCKVPPGQEGSIEVFA